MNIHNRLLSKYITSYMNENNYSLRQFGELSGISHSYINVLKRGEDPRNGKEPEPTINTLTLIAKATNVSLKSLLIKLRYIPEEDNNKNIDTKAIKDNISDIENFLNNIKREIYKIEKE